MALGLTGAIACALALGLTGAIACALAPPPVVAAESSRLFGQARQLPRVSGRRHLLPDPQTFRVSPNPFKLGRLFRRYRWDTSTQKYRGKNRDRLKARAFSAPSTDFL